MYICNSRISTIPISIVSSISSPSKSTLASSVSDIWLDMIALTVFCLTITYTYIHYMVVAN